MASDNETVAEAIVAVRKMIHDCPAINGGLGEFQYQLRANGALDRIEAANNRELATKDAEIAELRDHLEAATSYACAICGNRSAIGCATCSVFKASKAWKGGTDETK